jgi:hypothetical protein
MLSTLASVPPSPARAAEPPSEAAGPEQLPAACVVPHLLAENALRLYGLLGEHQAHFRRVLLSQLFRDLSAADVATLTGAGFSTVHAARREFKGDNIGDLGAKYPSGVHRQRVASAELAWIAEMIKNECATKGGDPLQLLTDEQLYQRYLQQYSSALCDLVQSQKAPASDEAAMRTLVTRFTAHQESLAFLAAVRSAPRASAASTSLAGGHRPGPIDLVLELLKDSDSAVPPPAPRSRSVFGRVLHSVPMQQTHDDWGQYDCTHCAQGRRAVDDVKRLESLSSLSAPQQTELARARELVEEYDDHLGVVHSQCQALDEALADPDPSHAVAVWDFAVIDAQPNVGDSAKPRPFHVLIFVLHRAGKRVYLDFFVQDSSAQSPDIFFTREVLLFLLQKTPFLQGLTLLTLCSDTAAGEFRSKHTIAQGASFQDLALFDVRLLFKAARHGKGIADAHKGHLMRILNRHLKEQTQLRHDSPATAAQLLTPFSDADSLARFFASSFKTVKYHAFVLDSVDRNPALKADVRAIPGTMRIHDVTFESADTVRVKHLSSDSRADIVHLHFKAPYAIGGESERASCARSFACVQAPLRSPALVQAAQRLHRLLPRRLRLARSRLLSQRGRGKPTLAKRKQTKQTNDTRQSMLASSGSRQARTRCQSYRAATFRSPTCAASST